MIGASGSMGSNSYSYDPNKPQFDLKEIDMNITGTTTVLPLPKQGDKALVYRSAPFSEDTTIAAPMTIDLYVSSTAKDATFNVMVIDEDEKGIDRFIGLPGNQRATYVDGKVKLLTPGKIVKITVEPWWFAREFKKGHKLVLTVSSDSYPRFARNPGTGEPDWKATKLIKATHTIYTLAKYPSKVTFWKLPK